MEIGIKTDCFAHEDSLHNPDGMRTALKGLYCKREKCKFYKSKRDYRKQCERSSNEE